MRILFLVGLLSMNWLQLWSQDIGSVEIQLSESVAAWQNAATDLDNAVVELNEIQRQYDDMVRARIWMQKNFENRKTKKESPKRIKKAKKAYKSGLKKEKKLLRKLNTIQRDVNNLTEKVEKNHQKMNRLMNQRDDLRRGGKGEKKVYSGYFPKYKSFYRASEKDNVYYNLPKFSCKTDYDGTDPVLQKHRIEYKESVFFRHQPAYMPLINDEAYLTASSYFTLVEGGQFFLNLNIRIHTDNPRQDYGYLERHSRLFITFLNGDELVLLNNLLNLGSFDRKKGVVVFRGQYSLNVYSQNKIKKNPIDKIRIEWAKGYEDYDVYHVDLLQKQFKCL